jgi:hypothetical protein
MARTWLRIRVDLLGGGGVELDPPPGRSFMVGPSHSFEQFAGAIDAAFARWDLSHLHGFELGDGRLIGYPDDSFEPDVVWLDHAKLKVAREVKPGEEFQYVFNLGDDWRHRCVWSQGRPIRSRSTAGSPTGRSRSGVGDRFLISTAAAASKATGTTRTTRTGRQTRAASAGKPARSRARPEVPHEPLVAKAQRAPQRCPGGCALARGE